VQAIQRVVLILAEMGALLVGARPFVTLFHSLVETASGVMGLFARDDG
jgi:hypothetical protein